MKREDMKYQDWRIEPILLLMFGGLVFFTVALMYVAHLFPGNDKLFIAISAVLSGFASAFFVRVNPHSMSQQDKDEKPSETDKEISA